MTTSSTSTVTTTETTTTDGLLIATSGDLNASVAGSATYCSATATPPKR